MNEILAEMGVSSMEEFMNEMMAEMGKDKTSTINVFNNSS